MMNSRVHWHTKRYEMVFSLWKSWDIVVGDVACGERFGAAMEFEPAYIELVDGLKVRGIG